MGGYGGKLTNFLYWDGLFDITMEFFIFKWNERRMCLALCAGTGGDFVCG